MFECIIIYTSFYFTSDKMNTNAILACFEFCVLCVIINVLCVEVVGAVISVLVIWVVTGILVYLAVLRVINPDYTINADIMLITAGASVAVNIL